MDDDLSGFAADAARPAPHDGRGKAEAVLTSPGLDITSDEDLGMGIMNLISLEEHLFLTANKTGKDRCYDLLLEIREMRKELLKQIVVSFEEEAWCIGKHLLATSMRLMEVGTKELKISGVPAARPYFEKSYRLFRMFWEVVLEQPERKAGAQASPAFAKTTLVVFYKPTCPHCKVLDSYLVEHRIDETFDIKKVDVTSDPAHRAEMEAARRHCASTDDDPVVPMVAVHGRCAMGASDSMRLIASLMGRDSSEARTPSASLEEGADVSAALAFPVDDRDKAVDAALNCCQE